MSRYRDAAALVEGEMAVTAGGRDERFFASRRGQVTSLLRGGDQSVEELAQALGLTDNAVRAHAVPAATG
jgi:hypothetical protein